MKKSHHCTIAAVLSSVDGGKCGGFSGGNVSDPSVNIDLVRPCTYVSTDRGITWTLNSSINPATEIKLIAFYYAKQQTNPVYFNVNK